MNARREPPPWIRLDKIDWLILQELQAEGRITNVELARRVGISPPPCLRRLRSLEEAGFILGYHAQLNPRLLGFEVEAYVMVRLNSQAEPDIAAFETLAREWPYVRECVLLTGEIDFLLKCVAPDLQSFQNFITRDLSAAPHIDQFRTAMAMRRAKSEPGLPLD